MNKSFGKQPGIQRAQDRYEKWWLGRMCRIAMYGGVYKKVVKIRLQGPPSFVYGAVELEFEDETKLFIPESHKNAYTPKRSDVEVLPLPVVTDTPPTEQESK